MDLTSHEMAAVAGVTFRQVDYWTRTGLLEALPRRSSSGHPRRYSPEEVQVAVMMGRLLRAGFDATLAAKCARLLVTQTAIQLGTGDDTFLLIRKIAVTPDDEGQA